MAAIFTFNAGKAVVQIAANSGYIKIIYRTGYEVYAIFKKQNPFPLYLP